MSEQVNNPHDKFFREVFSDPEMARELVIHYAPQELVETLDLTEFECLQGSFVDTELQEHHTDILYKTRFKTGEVAYIYFLFEHKSYPEPLIAFQLLRYIVRIWEQEQKAFPKRKTFIPIIPFVVYHGRTTWQVPLNFGALVENNAVTGKFSAEFHYHLLDLSRYTDEEVKGNVRLQAYLLLFKHIFNPDLRHKLPEILMLLHELEQQPTGLERLYTLLLYVSQAASKITYPDVKQAVSRAFPVIGGQTMSTLARNWIDQGIEEGIQQGITQARQDDILTIIKIRFGGISEKLVSNMQHIHDSEILKGLHEQAILSFSAEEFERKVELVVEKLV